MRVVHRIVFYLAFCHTAAVSAQSTAAYIPEIKLFKDAVELYDKQIYNQAIQTFEEYLRVAKDNPQTMDAHYYIASGKLYLEHNNGLAEMLAFIDKYPGSRKINNANLQIGNYHYQKGSYRQAIGYYKLVSQDNLTEMERDEMDYKYGYCLLKGNKLEDAKQRFYPLTQKENPYRDQSYYYYGYICMQNKEYRQALVAFKAIEHTGLPSVILYIAEIHYLDGEFQKSIDYILKNDFGKEQNRKNMLLGKCYYGLGVFDKAGDYFDLSNFDAEKLNDGEIYEIGYTYYVNKSCAKASILFERIANSGNALSQSAGYHLGDCFLKNNQKQNAFNAFYEAQRVNYSKPIQEEAMYAYAKLASELNYPDKAIAAYLKFTELFPMSVHLVPARKELANLLYTTNDYRSAIEVIESISIQDEETKKLHQNILYLRGQELFLQKDLSGAINHFNKAIKLNTLSSVTANSNFWLGEIHYKQDKMDAAKGYYQKFMDLSSNAKEEKYYPLAVYGLGYCFFNQKNWNSAAQYFNRYKTIVGYQFPDNTFYDATLRLADCYFMLKNLSGGLDAYTYIVSNKASGADYAMFQQGMIFGAQNKKANKIAVLRKIAREYPASAYIQDATYEIAKEYDELDEYVEAERHYNYLISDYPNSKYLKYCHMNLGQVYYRQSKDALALEQFKTVVLKYPGTAEAKEARGHVESIYLKQGQGREYLEWLKTLPQTTVSMGYQDSIIFASASRKYKFEDKNCAQATVDFDEYVKAFPNGTHKYEALYNAGYCYQYMREYATAISRFEKVIDGPSSDYKEDAINRLCDLHMINGKCDVALNYFIMLEKFATNTQNMKKALLGQLQCSNKTGNTSLAKEKATQLLRYSPLTSVEFGESNNTLGRIALSDSSYSIARGHFRQTLKKHQDVYGAEAKYYDAYIYYMNDSLPGCRKTILEFSNQFTNYHYWLGKTYVLLADYYIKKNEIFNAKATINNVLEQYQDFPEIISEAQMRLNAIEPKSNENDEGE